MDEKTRNTVSLPKSFQKALAELVNRGVYMGKQDAIRCALRTLFEKHKLEPFVPPTENTPESTK
ncbi:unnamed protein product [marine sediment metagenome]|uniref:Ribbon-helix-helix protein CopG domain-containing protein n=1 Tax=marine sediment metagenome TaxID=412755 RepID=X1T843_9ZZZZ